MAKTVKLVFACAVPISIGYYLMYEGVSDFRKQLSPKSNSDRGTVDNAAVVNSEKRK